MAGKAVNGQGECIDDCLHLHEDIFLLFKDDSKCLHGMRSFVKCGKMFEVPSNVPKRENVTHAQNLQTRGQTEVLRDMARRVFRQGQCFEKEQGLSSASKQRVMTWFVIKDRICLLKLINLYNGKFQTLKGNIRFAR